VLNGGMGGVGKPHSVPKIKGMRYGLILTLALLGLCLSAHAQAQDFTPGKITPKVTCPADPTQDYALYVPSNYDPKRAWPIVLAFDAAARGLLPVELARAAAEKYGYIVAGSNQSANFDGAAQRAAVKCLSQDTQSRLHVDARRVYVAGFSGGARLAAGLAESCAGEPCIAGVIAHGAGFPAPDMPKRKTPYVYFATVGELDFNHAEMIEVRHRLERAGVPHRLVVFPGPHQWSRAETWMEAFAWLNVQAMRAGLLAKDEAFIAEQLGAARERAEAAEQRGDAFTAWREYAGIALDFAGLVDVTPFARKAAELRESKAVKEGARRERDAIERQRLMERDIAQLYPQMSESDRSVMEEVVRKVTMLRDRAAKAQAEEKLIAQRALSAVTALLFEGAQGDRQARRWRLAGMKSEAASASVEKPTRGLVQAAKDYARAGDEGSAMRCLRRAIENGFADKGHLRAAEEFAGLREREEFRRLVE